MEERKLDFVLVPLGLLLLALYHLWLLAAIIWHPTSTVIGINAIARRRWVQAMMADSLKNGVLAVQTLRNNIMASTVLATTAITLASLISVFVSATSNASSLKLIYGNKTSLASSVKLFSVSLCYILAFLCNIQAIRYYAHVSFLITIPPSGVNNTRDLVSVQYVARSLNRGSFFWSLGLRAFYVSFTLFLWIFGPIPMLFCCIVACSLLYFLDSTTENTRVLHESFWRAEKGVGEASV